MLSSRMVLRNACVTRTSTSHILRFLNQQPAIPKKGTLLNQVLAPTGLNGNPCNTPRWLCSMVTVRKGKFGTNHLRTISKNVSHRRVSSSYLSKYVSAWAKARGLHTDSELCKRSKSEGKQGSSASKTSSTSKIEAKDCNTSGMEKDMISMEECDQRCEKEVRDALEQLTKAMNRYASEIVCAKVKTTGKKQKKKKKNDGDGNNNDPCAAKSSKPMSTASVGNVGKSGEKKCEESIDDCIKKLKDERKKLCETSGKQSSKDAKKAACESLPGRDDPCKAFSEQMKKLQDKWKAAETSAKLEKDKKSSKSASTPSPSTSASQKKHDPGQKSSKTVTQKKEKGKASCKSATQKKPDKETSKKPSKTSKDTEKKASKASKVEAVKEVSKTSSKSAVQKKANKAGDKEKSQICAEKQKNNDPCSTKTAQKKTESSCKTKIENKEKEDDPCKKINEKDACSKECKITSVTDWKPSLAEKPDPCSNIGSMAKKKSGMDIPKSQTSTMAKSSTKKPSGGDLTKGTKAADKQKPTKDKPSAKMAATPPAKKQSTADLSKSAKPAQPKKSDKGIAKPKPEPVKKPQSKVDVSKSCKPAEPKATSKDIPKKLTSSEASKKICKEGDDDPCKNVGMKSSSTSSDTCKKIASKKDSTEGSCKQKDDPCANIGQKDSCSADKCKSGAKNQDDDPCAAIGLKKCSSTEKSTKTSGNIQKSAGDLPSPGKATFSKTDDISTQSFAQFDYARMKNEVNKQEPSTNMQKTSLEKKADEVDKFFTMPPPAPPIPPKSINKETRNSELETILPTTSSGFKKMEVKEGGKESAKANEMEISTNATAQKMSLKMPPHTESFVLEFDLDHLRNAGPLTTRVSAKDDLVQVEQKTSDDLTREFRKANMTMPVTIPPTSLTKIKLYALRAPRRRQKLSKDEAKDIKRFLKAAAKEDEPDTLVFKAKKIVRTNEHEDDGTLLGGGSGNSSSRRNFHRGRGQLGTLQRNRFKMIAIRRKKSGFPDGRDNQENSVSDNNRNLFVNNAESEQTLEAMKKTRHDEQLEQQDTKKVNFMEEEKQKRGIDERHIPPEFVQIDVKACAADTHLEAIDAFKKLTQQQYRDTWLEVPRPRARTHQVVLSFYSAGANPAVYTRNLQQSRRIEEFLAPIRQTTQNQRLHTKCVPHCELVPPQKLEAPLASEGNSGSGSGWMFSILSYVVLSKLFPKLGTNKQALPTTPGAHDSKLISTSTALRLTDEDTMKVQLLGKKIKEAQDCLELVRGVVANARGGLDLQEEGKGKISSRYQRVLDEMIGTEVKIADFVSDIIDRFDAIKVCNKDELWNDPKRMVLDQKVDEEMPKSVEEMEQQLDAIEAAVLLVTKFSGIEDLFKYLERT